MFDSRTARTLGDVGFAAWYLCGAALAFAFSVHAAAAAEALVDPPTVAGSQHVAPWDVVPTDEELADAFLLALRGASSQLGDGQRIVVRRWQGPVKLLGWSPTATGKKVHHRRFPNKEFATVWSMAQKATGLRFQVAPASRVSGSMQGGIIVHTAAIGPHLKFEVTSVELVAPSLKEVGATVSDPQIVYAGASWVRSAGAAITAGRCKINYSYASQYLHYDLPVDILRTRGLTVAQIAAKIDTSKWRPEAWNHPVAREILDQYLRDQEVKGNGPRAMFEQRCLHRDYNARLHRIFAHCLSDTLGLPWGEAERPDWDRPGGYNEMLRDAFHGILTKQTFRGADYWTFAHSWQLLLNVLYDPRIKSGMSAENLRTVALGIIRERRAAFERRYPRPKESCTGLAEF